MARKRKQGNLEKKTCDIVFIEWACTDWCAHHEKWFKACEECDRGFHASRSDARFCSNACRQKNYRHDQLEMFPDLSYNFEDGPNG